MRVLACHTGLFFAAIATACLLPSIATAGEITGGNQVGVSTGVGFGADLHVQLPLGLDANAQGAYVPESYSQASAWMSIHLLGQSSFDLELLTGADFDWQQGVSLAGGTSGSTLNPGRLGYLVGVAYRLKGDRWWIRLSPSVSIIPRRALPPRPDQPLEGEIYQPPELIWLSRSIASGPPLLSMGYRPVPGFELGLQTTITPVRAGWMF